MMEKSYYRPVKTETSLPPPAGRNSFTGKHATRIIQLSAQAITTAHRHPHADLDDMMAFHPPKDNGIDETRSQSVHLEESRGSEVSGEECIGAGEKSESAGLSEEYELVLRYYM
jgi:hypothetical protein